MEDRFCAVFPARFFLVILLLLLLANCCLLSLQPALFINHRKIFIIAMPTINFVNEKKQIEVPEGTNLRRAAMQSGIQVYEKLTQ